MGTSLSLREVSVTFGGLKALNNVTVEFSEGKVTGLIGPNGSGKSTLVNSSTGGVRLSAGSVRLGDRDITRSRGDQIVAAGLARTYQVPKFPKELTALEVVSVPFHFLGSRERRAAFDTPEGVLEFCAVDHEADARCSSLSVPQLRRLGIARALACAPDVLLLDEVMASLPAHDAATAISLIRRVRDEGITVVVIEHVMRIIADVCDEIIVLNLGTVLASGRPHEVLAMPEVRTAYLGKGFSL